MPARRSQPDARPEDPIGGGFLKRVTLIQDRVPSFRKYPWSIPALRNLGSLELHPRVSFFVGENGSGKSTLLEAIAQAAGFGEQGGGKNFNLATREYWSELGRTLEIARSFRREKDGFFLRAESFYNVATQIEELGVSLKYYGGRSPHEQSHGEAFLALAANRFAGEGLYLLDEPEAALSPARQLAFLRILHLHAQRLGSQFLIATHSPLILAYPDATLYEFTGDGVQPVEYERTEHFQLTRDFLNSREHYFRHLFSDPDEAAG